MRGVKTVIIHTSTQNTRWATLVVTVCANRKKLPSMLIIKTKQNGRIAVKEFPTFPTGFEYYCQENAWMDKGAIQEWDEKNLKQLIATMPEIVVPLLMLDSYKCHMLALVVHTIQQLGMDVKHIPGGFVSLSQPVDVGISRSL